MGSRTTAAAAAAVLLLLSHVPAIAQDAPGLRSSDPTLWVGATLADAYAALGVPVSVSVARGTEAWQDDVVLSYPAVDLYCCKDRVWEARVDAAYGLRKGAGRDEVLAALGQPLHRLDADFVYQMPAHAWPVRLRVRFDESGAAKEYFAYRADY